MKKLLFALVATLVAVSVSGCVGFGKARLHRPSLPRANLRFTEGRLAPAPLG